MNPVPRRRLLQAAALSTLLPVRAMASPVSKDEVAALLKARLRHEGVGLAVAGFGADGVLATAAGLTRRGGEAVDVARHRFEIGSITKTMTGVLLADAVLRREVTLAQPVESLLPDGLRLRDSADAPIRLVDLATHRSGLPRQPDNFNDSSIPDPLDPYAAYDDAALMAGVRQFKPSRTRDARFEYSNFGFGLLAWVIARQAKLGLPDLFRQRLFQPLGLSRAEWASPGATAVDNTQGHDPAGQAVPAWHFLALGGAGAVRASAADLARYGQAALGHFEHPLRAAFEMALQVHSPLGDSPDGRMGLGWGLRPDSKLASHDGATIGYFSSLQLHLGERRGALALSNARLDVDDLARHLLDLSHPLRDIAAEQQAQEARAAVQRLSAQQSGLAPRPEALALLAGVYALNPRSKLSIRAQGSQLFAQILGLGEAELFAKSPRLFFALETPLEIEFEGAEGAAPALVLRLYGQVQRYTKA